MNETDYTYLCDFLKERSGLSLGANKKYLVEARLVPIAQSVNLSGLHELVEHLRRGRDEKLAVAVTEAMTTNETSFFRDRVPFDELRKFMLPQICEARRVRHSLRIWSAASSTGQEAFSIAMTLKDSLPDFDQWRIEIVATDIAQKILDRAKTGEYSQLEVQRGLPAKELVLHFEKTAIGFRVKPELQRMIRWKQLNLFDDFRGLGQFDIVFCRNVLIYFEVEDKADILGRIRNQMSDDGFLVLGAAETVIGLTDGFDRNRACQSAVYSPAGARTLAISR